jgi:excinuclease ABC subunit C
MPDKDHIKEIIKVLPYDPGVYLYMNNRNEVIYVGKAKNLKKRVSSYFNKNNTGKTKILVNNIRDMNYVVVESENDALLLENNLIKKYKPRYNVLLKDDKSFPWICIKKEHFPRVFFTRNKINDGSEYFGPYTSVVMARTLMDLVRQLYQLRNCKLNLSPKNIAKGKYKVCLEYHLGNCLAPCIGKQEEEDYIETIQYVRKILKGNLHTVIDHLKTLMKTYAADYKFEDAELVREKIETIKNYKSKSTIVSPRISNLDVFYIVDDETSAFVNYQRVINGAVIQSHSVEMKKKLEESKEELLSLAMVELRRQFESDAKETLIPFRLEYSIQETRLVIPRRGEKKKLLELSERNARYFRMESLKRKQNLLARNRKEDVLKQVQADLRLKEIPEHIECFDNSNIQGKYPVASCVVFRHGKPSNKDYRQFNIKTVTGANDFASMEEIIYRRYKRLIEEKKPLPQLIIVDGGKGQLNAAVKSLEKLDLRGTIPVFGIAKRLEEIFIPGDPVPLYLNKNSVSLKLIQHLRNEAHRFGITFHRQKRSGDFLKSELDKIKGIGPATFRKLMLEFKSVEKIKNLKEEELLKVIGRSKARILMDYFKNSPE